MGKPTRPIGPPGFKYIPASQTDIRVTIRREQRRLEALRRAQQGEPPEEPEELPQNVVGLRKQGG